MIDKRLGVPYTFCFYGFLQWEIMSIIHGVIHPKDIEAILGVEGNVDHQVDDHFLYHGDLEGFNKIKACMLVHGVQTKDVSEWLCYARKPNSGAAGVTLNVGPRVNRTGFNIQGTQTGRISGGKHRIP